ncbi:MAG: sodium-transporting two-sector ATPase [Candidatus Saccharimonadales bacterium]
MDGEGNKQFEQLVASGNPVGEVIGVDKFLVRVRGLHPTNTHALIMFADGTKGYVHHVYEEYVIVMHLGDVPVELGMQAVVQHPKLVTKVGRNFIGRVVSITGEPLDGKGPIVADGSWPVFHNAPMIYERELVDAQLETGVTVLDTMFSLVRGQRMAILGDGKSGKSTLTSAIAINQRSSDITVIYVLIAKRRSDVKTLVAQLEENQALEKAIVVVSTMFESLVISYLAPYVGAAMGEYFWQHLDMDTLVIYDDLTSHAQAYREISLIAGVSPGRDSYPGDMFYAHSQLVERAGKIERNHKTQTILPIVYAPLGDITAYLPTNVMSMTDGQWILDMKVFRDTMRPAINTGLSVTRVGGVGQAKRHKLLAGDLAKALAAYRAADEFAHFGSELSGEAKHNLETGKMLYQLMNQVPGETYSLMAQQLMLDVILHRQEGDVLDIKKLKSGANEIAKTVKDVDPGGNFDAVRDELKASCLLESAPPKVAEEEAKENDDAADGKDTQDSKGENSDKKEKKKDDKKSGEKSDEPDKKAESQEDTKDSVKKDDSSKENEESGGADPGDDKKSTDSEPATNENEDVEKKKDSDSKDEDADDQASKLTPGEIVAPNGEHVESEEPEAAASVKEVIEPSKDNQKAEKIESGDDTRQAKEAKA